MKIFRSVNDLGNLNNALKEAFEIKADKFKYQHLGRNKTALLIFFNNRNRIIIIIPCHRVVNKNGTSGGFSYGTQMKNYLLNLEKCNK